MEFTAYKAQTGADADKYAANFCSFEGQASRPKDLKKQCRFDLNQLYPCWENKTDFKFGYDKGEPCIFFRMNKVRLCFAQSLKNVLLLFMFLNSSLS